MIRHSSLFIELYDDAIINKLLRNIADTLIGGWGEIQMLVICPYVF